MFDKFLCWFFGHEPMSIADDVLELRIVLDDEMDVNYLTFCGRCDAILTYDENLDGWVKW